VDLKTQLIILSDKLDRLGLLKDANIIDSLLKTALDKGFLEDLEDELKLDEDSDKSPPTGS
tara:strand:- start:235 stop:417 length:183 start_codon:yes stop_codon:yes gene_type:complete